MSELHHKTLFVLLDGVGDVTIPSLATPSAPHGRTPLQAAHTPTLDLLASYGLCGLMDSVEAGQACGSDTAHLSLLGYDPQLYYRGRGAFEAQGSGLSMQTGDIAFKSNFAWMDADSSAGTSEARQRGPKGVVRKRRADRSFHQWGLPLIAALDGLSLPSFPEVQVAVQHATEHRVGVRLRGPGLTDLVTGTDPLVDGRELRTCKPTDAVSSEAKRTSAVVNELSARIHEILSSHPLNLSRAQSGLPTANIVLLRGAGARIGVPAFAAAQGLSRALMVAPTAIIAGLGTSVGFEVEKVRGATGDYHTDLLAKARHVVARMRDPTPAAPSAAAGAAGVAASSQPFDFAFLHVKAVDDAGHDRDVARKVEWIERSDAMLAEILRLLRADSAHGSHGSAATTSWSLVVTGDHSTPVRYGDHSVEPVPFLLTALQHLPAFGAQLPTISPALKASLAHPRALALQNICCSPAHNPVRHFDEESCSRGVLGRFPGREVQPLLRRFREQLVGAEAAAGAAAAQQSTQPKQQQSHAHMRDHAPVPLSSAPHATASTAMQAPLQQQQLQPHPTTPTTPAGASAASLPHVLPLAATCREGVSAWEDDGVQASLARFSPAAGTELPKTADVLIIGAGFTGLCTAWELGRAGMLTGSTPSHARCLLLDRGFIGSGATGRNGGHMHGDGAREEADICTFLKLLREAGVDPERDFDWRQKGGVHMQKNSAFAASAAASAVAAGASPERLSHPAMHSDTYSPLSLRASAGTLHPLKLLRCLASILASQYELPVWQHTPVAKVTPDPTHEGQWLVHTARGVVRAKAVVHATNAWAAELLPSLKGVVRPVRNHLLQTTPIKGPTRLPTLAPEDGPPTAADGADPSAIAGSRGAASSPAGVAGADDGALWTGLSVLWNDTFDYLMQRPPHADAASAPGGRAVLGGHRYMAPRMDLDQSDATKPLLPYVLLSLRGLLPRVFPPLFRADGPNPPGSVECSHAWAGILGFTPTFNPVVGGVSAQLRGQFVAAGFSGHGMPRCHPAGVALASQVIAYLRSGAFEPADVATVARGTFSLQPSDELLRDMELTRAQLAHMQQQHAAEEMGPTSKL